MMTDLRHARAIRLAGARWFAIGAVCTFALGIGLNVAVFSMVDRMLFKPLPYGHADRLFEIGLYSPGMTRPVRDARRALRLRSAEATFWIRRPDGDEPSRTDTRCRRTSMRRRIVALTDVGLQHAARSSR